MGTHWNCIRWVCHTFWHSIYSSESSEGSITCWLSLLFSVSCGMHFISPSKPYHKMLQSQLFPFGTNLLTMLLSTRQAVLMSELCYIYSESWINPGPKKKPHPRMNLLIMLLFGTEKGFATVTEMIQSVE